MRYHNITKDDMLNGEGLRTVLCHLRSSWEVLRADQPLNVLYGLLRGDALPDG